MYIDFRAYQAESFGVNEATQLPSHSVPEETQPHRVQGISIFRRFKIFQKAFLFQENVCDMTLGLISRTDDRQNNVWRPEKE
jgi:hypothetical protein